MFNNDLKKINLLTKLMKAKTPLARAKIGLKLITRSDVRECYDVLWVLNESIHGDRNLFLKRVSSKLEGIAKGEDVQFNVQNICTVQPSEILAMALHEAEGGHLKDGRKGILNRTYLHHILKVWFLVALCGGDENQQIAALLHDYLEDVPDKAISFAALRRKIELVFGKVVVGYCLALKNKNGLSGKTPEKAKQKHAWQLNHLSKMLSAIQLIKFCDRLANLYDCRRDGPASNSPLSILSEIDKWTDFCSVGKGICQLVDDVYDYIYTLLDKKYDLQHVKI